MINRSILLYILISFGFSWGIAALLHFSGGINFTTAGALLFAYMCGPAVGALICTWLFEAGQREAALGIRPKFNWWLLAAYLIGIAIVLGASILAFLFTPITPVAPLIGYTAILNDAGMDVGAMLENIPYINAILVAQFVLLAPLLNIPLMLSEELGWRGWLWHKLRPKGFWTVTFWTGLLWGLWHIPIIAMGHNYPGMPVWGPIIFTVFCILYAPLYSFIREKSGSVWGACILHAAGNGVAALGLSMQSSIEMPWRGVVGIGGFIMVILLSGLVVIWFFRGKNHSKMVNSA